MTDQMAQEISLEQQLSNALRTIKRLTILLGLEAGEFSAEQAEQLLEVDRARLRDIRQFWLDQAASYRPIQRPRTPFDQWKADSGW